jgi:phosphoglycerol transferase MdoB-like AlkP superfamily enzyme
MNLVARVKGILTNPRQEWTAIDAEPLDLTELLTKYVLPLSAIGPIAMFIGLSTFGGVLIPMSTRALLMNAILSYVLGIVALFVCAWIINALAPTFGATPSMSQAIKVVAYASTAAWVAAIFNIIPLLAIIAVIGALYSLYLFFVGLPILMKPPPDKAVTYTVVVIVVTVILFVVIGSITTRMRY